MGRVGFDQCDTAESPLRGPIEWVGSPGLNRLTASLAKGVNIIFVFIFGFHISRELLMLYINLLSVYIRVMFVLS